VLSPCGSSATAVKVGFTGTPDSNNDKLLKIDSDAYGTELFHSIIHQVDGKFFRFDGDRTSVIAHIAAD
jgi:hypothetical protein